MKPKQAVREELIGKIAVLSASVGFTGTVLIHHGLSLPNPPKLPCFHGSDLNLTLPHYWYSINYFPFKQGQSKGFPAFQKGKHSNNLERGFQNQLLQLGCPCLHSAGLLHTKTAPLYPCDKLKKPQYVLLIHFPGKSMPEMDSDLSQCEGIILTVDSDKGSSPVYEFPALTLEL